MARLAAENKLLGSMDITDELIRKLCLSTLKPNISNFKAEFGSEIIIACDNRLGYWRKSKFPFYKANRKKIKAKMNIDFVKVGKSLEVFKKELKENFPYIVIESRFAEADDVIGAVVYHKSSSFGEVPNILIISGDHDFIQLQKFKNIRQWNPVQKKYISHNNPEQFLLEHVIRGDTGDGIPNVFSDDDTLVMAGKRQKPATTKRIEELLSTNKDNWNEVIKARHDMNKKLIDLRLIPDVIRDDIINQYETGPCAKDKRLLFNYFLHGGVPEYVSHTQDF